MACEATLSSHQRSEMGLPGWRAGITVSLEWQQRGTHTSTHDSPLARGLTGLVGVVHRYPAAVCREAAPLSDHWRAGVGTRQSHHFDGVEPHWFHQKCFYSKFKGSVLDLDDVEGGPDLRWCHPPPPPPPPTLPSPPPSSSWLREGDTDTEWGCPSVSVGLNRVRAVSS
jgi:hypothetical protein